MKTKIAVVLSAATLAALLSGCGADYNNPPQQTYQNDNGDIYIQRVPVDGHNITCFEWSGDGISCDWNHPK